MPHMKGLPFLCIWSSFHNTSNGGTAAQWHSLPFPIWHLSPTAPNCAYGGALSPLDPRVNLPPAVKFQLRNWKNQTSLRSVSLRLNCSIFTVFLETNIYEHLLIISKRYIKRPVRLWHVTLSVLNCTLFNRNKIFVWDILCQSISHYLFFKYHFKCHFLAFHTQTSSYTIVYYKVSVTSSVCTIPKCPLYLLGKYTLLDSKFSNVTDLSIKMYYNTWE